MLSAISIVPSAPVLVPELTSGAAAELADLTAAVQCAAKVLPSRWVAVGVGPQDGQVRSDAVGTFAGYGADVRVTFAPDMTGEVRPLPLCALIAGWLRGTANPEATVDMRVYADDLAAEVAVELGRVLRDELDTAPDPVGVLVVADGANTLTTAAPGGFDPDSVARQAQWDDALATGDIAALARLSGVLGRVGYQVLAGLAGSDPKATELYRGAPYGVGYFVGTWIPQ
ncbi:class III extradiol ring-cleavage dioxygenase family protein [Mycolicibacterium aubagnense]|uniref:Uncharacterized protein n=1 Tax=Mycolicibacterium aubagnense TaxID=319707 RepID=A0ABN5Z1G6_9MYCO|nr:hypothetical protein [Mycolicibacterium aubagnense]TLH64941.1 hypothetical protein C1S80_11610 [Mycolicibacterium aubagnense]WGI30869.1 hypothetical protein QDT91_16430 [Mycolicibacterium aubagnense]BBX87778.1 hypothetical protein MAUB_56510 [Mycolicibacterium aubagnense]